MNKGADQTVTPPNTPIVFKAPDTASIEQRAATLKERLAALKITDDQSYIAAGELLTRAIAEDKAVDEDFKEMTEALDRAHKAATSLRARHKAPFREVIAAVRPMISDWLEAETKRRNAEAAKLTAAAVVRREDDKVEEAVALEKAGKHEEAAQIIERPVVPPAVSVAPPPRLDGLNLVTVTKYEVIDKNQLRDEFTIADDKSIGALVKAMGVRAIEAVSKPAPPDEFKPAIKVTVTQEPRAAGRRS